jgi:hypothetical protein
VVTKSDLMKKFILAFFLMLSKFSYSQNIVVSNGSLVILVSPEYISDSLYRFKIKLYNRSNDRIFLVQDDSGKIAVRLFCGTWDKCQSIAVRGGLMPMYDPHGFGKFDEVKLVELKSTDSISLLTLPVSSSVPLLPNVTPTPRPGYGKLISKEAYKNDFAKTISWNFIQVQEGVAFNTLTTREKYDSMKREEITVTIYPNN